jgi:hypothetical protein
MSKVNSQTQSETTTIIPYMYWAIQVLYGHEVHMFKLESDKLIELQPWSEDKDAWYLEPGEYVLVDIERPSNKGEPYTIEVGELYVSANPRAVNRAVYRPLSLAEVMDLDKERCKREQLLEEAKEAIKGS